MCLRTISIFFSVNYLFIICSLRIDCWSFFYWLAGGSLCVRDPFSGYEFQIKFISQCCLWCVLRLSWKKRSHTVMRARHCTLSCVCSHVLLPLALWGLLLGLSALGPQWRSLPIYSRLGTQTFLAAWESLTLLVLVWSFASCGPHYFSS